jgi:tetratricopeptide (TPR) repeat protein
LRSFIVFPFYPRWRLFIGAWGLFLCFSSTCIEAQTQVDFGTAVGDPVKLFELGQDFHANNQVEKAIVCYEAALLLRLEFPEAEYQRASALVSLGRRQEAETALRRAIAITPEWVLPHAALGALLVQLNKPQEAEISLENAFKLEPSNPVALNALVELRLLSPLNKATLATLLERLKSVTTKGNPPSSLWLSQSSVERVLGRSSDALVSLGRALESNPRSLSARQQRAELLRDLGRYEEALEDARALAAAAGNSRPAILFLAHLNLQAGRKDDALRALDNLTEEGRNHPEVITLYNSILLQGPVDEETCNTLAQLETQQGTNAAFMARLGACQRLQNPARSLEYYRKAASLEPRNADYAVGYASALVQGRRFPEAIVILRRVLEVAPEHHTAHANLATALFESKDFAGAAVEFRWLAHKQPENAVTFYFLGVTWDRLTEFPAALTAYEQFLNKADANVHKLEIERVNLRLPSLRKQIKNGEGAKKQGN